MAKRKGKKRGSRRKKNINLLRLAEAGVVASIMTTNMAGTSLRNFFTNENPADGITFMELIRGDPGMVGSKATNFVGRAPMTAGKNWQGLWENSKANMVPLVGGLILTPVVFRSMKRLARMPLSEVRGLLKGTGVTV